MFRTTTGWVVSPTDLVDTLECDHRSALKTALAARVEGAPAPADIDPLVAQHGLAHEQAELERLSALVEVARMPDPRPEDASLAAAAQATADAMAAGVPVIYQGSFHHRLTEPDPGGQAVSFHGRADFLIRSDLDPATGRTRTPAPSDWTYEPWDTKLARRPGPGAVVQLAAYAHAVSVATGRAPQHMHLLTGDNHTHTLPTADFTPILSTVTTRLLTLLATEPAL
ncbi:ATPase, partial [Nocardiopsis dassonvillei subsp. albirubida]|nr:ATPase [Nocardiopsis alborubida]